ncbi:MAG: hypothetical protein OHK0029_42960 [Armatimonadaceae bacterium]
MSADNKIIDIHCGWGATAAAPYWNTVDTIRSSMQIRGITTVMVSSLLARRYDVIAGNEALAGVLPSEPPTEGTDVRGWFVIHPARTRDVLHQMREYLYSPMFVGAALYADPVTGVPVTVSDAHDLVTGFRRYGKPLLVEVPTADAMREALRIADDLAGVRIIASGMGGDDWREAIAMSTRASNMALDISGALVPEKIEYAIEILHGTRKLLFASGAPHTDPAAVLALLDELDLADEDRHRILHGNAERLFGMETTTEVPVNLMPMDGVVANYLVGREEEAETPAESVETSE